MGAPLELAEYFFHDSVAYLKEVASRTTSCLEGTIAISSKGRIPLIFKEPIGPVLAMAPWNAASILGMRAVATPLAAGCPVVFKSSERSPNSHWLTLKCFTEAGVPAGAFNFINSDPETTPAVVEALAGSPYIRKINFTGSTRVGREIAVAASKHLKPLVLELGGKNPIIIDSGLSKQQAKDAAFATLFGSWLGNGQICMSTDRIYIMREYYEEFIGLLRTQSEHFNKSKNENMPSLHFDPTHYRAHPQSSVQAVQTLKELVVDALDKGATLVAGQLDPAYYRNDNSNNDNTAKATLFHKTILADVTPEMRLYTEESFGPVASVYPVASIAEAVALANESEYALSASVWTPNAAKGIAIGKALHSGAVHINGSTIHDEGTMPHGGIKNSGYGRFGGKWGLEEYTVTKSITLPELNF
jgi:acyl-CoA reductase-like NAD-dependent aldehyde dehydrogenase